MSETRDSARPVRLNGSSLQIWGLDGTGYSVTLEGEVDETWADSFALSQHAQGGATQFYLDRRRRVLVFSTEAGEGPQKSLLQAETLLDLTNRRVGRQATERPIGAARSGAGEGIERSATPGTPVPAEGIKRSSREATRLKDTRGSSRVGASLMVEFIVGSNVGPGSASTGMTRDLSEAGVFIVTNRLPSVGERLNLRVHLAAQKRIDLSGEVVRVLDKDEARRMALRPGFAARVTDSSGKDSFHLLVRSQSVL